LSNTASISGSGNYNAGSWDVTPSNAVGGTFNPSNYTISYVPGTLTVNQATLTVLGTLANNKVYDGTTNATIDTTGSVLSGVFVGDNVNLDATAATGAFNSKDVLSANTVTVSGMAINGADSGNYILTQPTASAIITPATLTVTGIVAFNKPYDGTATANGTDAGAGLVGVIGGDNVTLDTSSIVGTFSTSNAGNGITVVVTGLALTGPDASNYSLPTPQYTTTANITPAPLTITANNQTLTYGNSNLGNSAFISSGLQNGETIGSVTLLSNTASTSGSGNYNVGTWDVTPSNAVGGTFNPSNYTISYVPGTLTVNPATLTVTGTAASNKVYDGTTNATIDTSASALSGVISGDIVGLDSSAASGTFNSKDVLSANTVTVSGMAINGTDSGNYTLTQPTVSANITPAPLSVTGTTANNKVYDGTTSATINTTASVLSGVIGGDNVNLNVTGAIGAFNSKDVVNSNAVTVSGMTLSGTDSADYTVTQPTIAASITPAPLTISATSDSKVYDGTTNSTALPTTSTVYGTDTVTGLSQAFGSKDVLGAGSSTIAVTGYVVNDGNGGNDYTVTTSTATGTITPAPLTISATSDTKVYDGTTNSTALPTTSTLYGTDTVTGLSQAFGSKDALGASSSTVAVTGYTVNDGNGGNDYTVSLNTATGTITPAPLTITANNQTLTYGNSSLGTSGFTTSGLQNGETVGSVTLSTNATLSTSGNYNAGSWNITPSNPVGGTFNAGDYAISYTPGALTVNPAALTVSGITASNKLFDGTTTATINTTGAALAGVVAGDVVNLNTSGATGTFNTSAVGTGNTVTVSGLALSGADSNNYTITPPQTTANITSNILNSQISNTIDQTNNNTNNANTWQQIFNAFNPVAPEGGAFLYHPLIDIDSSAFDQQFQLDEGAYDFIDQESGGNNP